MTAPDARPTLHNHPWHFVSLVVRGGYIERRLHPHTMAVDGHHRVRRVNWLRMHQAHSIHTLLRVPTWTLVLVGKKRRKWGFLEPDGPVVESMDGRYQYPTFRWRWTAHDAFDSGHYS
jgi:hypothetical protein